MTIDKEKIMANFNDRIKKYSKLIGITFAASSLVLGRVSMENASEVEKDRNLIAQLKPNPFERNRIRS